MKKSILLVFVACGCILAGCSAPSRQSGTRFVQYAIDFQVPVISSRLFPAIAELPKETYNDATLLKQSSPKTHALAVALILTKYHHFYMAHFRQGYSFVSPMELSSGEFLQPGNTRLYLVREFIEISGIYPTIQDGLPSVFAMQWFETHCDTSNRCHTVLREAWMADKAKSRDILDCFLQRNPNYPKEAFKNAL